jgi:thioesterase domain-containing protein/acyl carrier protein
LLRFIRSSSASLPPQVMAELESVFNAPVIEAYGMTEAAHQMASNPLPPVQRKPGSVGLPAGPEVAIMDEAGALLPPGEQGEIVIRGANVTRGYQNNPEANEKAFTQGWFRTGDEGYFDHEGYLFITGRLKEMINRGGEKIAPREVDEALLAHPAIAQAITFAVPHPTLSEDIAAAVILKEGSVLTEQAIRQFAFAHLANHKVPSQILIVDAIPQGATGKLQRIGLADKLGSQLKPAFAPPRTPTETTLACLWAKVLGLEKVGLDDNFFTLGGDSLRATQLVSQVQASFQVELALPIIFQEPSLAGQAAIIEQIKTELQPDQPAATKPAARQTSALIPLRAQGTRPPLFCIPGNLGNVFTDLKYLVRHLGPDQPVYGLQDNAHNPIRIEPLATFYLQEIRRVQPAGPYFLAGICSGAVIAFEMARQLRAQGQQVGLLALIEPTLPSEPGPRPYLRLVNSILGKIIRRFTRHWQNFSRLDSTTQQSYARLKLKVIGNNWAAAAYHPNSYPGRLSLFLTQDSLAQAAPDVPLTWQARAIEGAELFELPGSHDTITGNNNTPIEEAPMQVLAEQLRHCLDRALFDLPAPTISNPPGEQISR